MARTGSGSIKQEPLGFIDIEGTRMIDDKAYLGRRRELLKVRFKG